MEASRGPIGSKPYQGVPMGAPYPTDDDSWAGDHINPNFGSAVFFAAGLAKLYPPFRWGAFLLGVGGAVVNYGSEIAGDGEQPESYVGGAGGGF